MRRALALLETSSVLGTRKGLDRDGVKETAIGYVNAKNSKVDMRLDGKAIPLESLCLIPPLEKR